MSHRVGCLINGRYRLVRVVARSLLSTVYEGRHVHSGARVAVKVLEREVFPQPRDHRQIRFHREARLLGRLTSPRIVRIHDYGHDGSVTFLVMEWLEGRTLRERIIEEGPLPVSQAVDLVVQIAEGLADAHRQGIVHRDVKPGNVMVCADGDARVAKLIDFGIGRELGAGSALTLYSGLVGSPRYMAPEQILGRPVCARVDQYGLGLLLCTVLTGEPPFGGRTLASVLIAHLREAPPDLVSHLGPGATAIAHVVTRCVAKRPEDRFPSMRDVMDALNAARLGHRATIGGWAASGIAAPSRQTRSRRTTPLWWILMIGIGSCVAGALVTAAMMLLWIYAR